MAARDLTAPDSSSGRGKLPHREPLSGLVELVTLHNAESGFCVLRVKVDTSKNPIWPQVTSKNSNGLAPREIAYLEVFRGVQVRGHRDLMTVMGDAARLLPN